MVQQKWKELSINEARFLGRVVGDPIFSPTANEECVWIKLATVVRQPDANGQYVDSEQIIPLLVLDTPKVNVVKNHVKDGKQISVRCYYKTWKHEGADVHGLVVMQLDLGHSAQHGSEE